VFVVSKKELLTKDQLLSQTKKVHGLVEEFKTFALRGNVIDLAVGVIIGGAFQKIVTSVVKDLIMPLVGRVTGGVNFNDQYFILNPDKVNVPAGTSLTVANDMGATTFNYGAFITNFIDFIIMAFVIFLIVKGINKLSDIRKKPVEEVVTTKECPFCRTEIHIEATRCPHCTSKLDD
jgi:large conductance mechanosensitive channel